MPHKVACVRKWTYELALQSRFTPIRQSQFAMMNDRWRNEMKMKTKKKQKNTKNHPHPQNLCLEVISDGKHKKTKCTPRPH